MHPIRERSRSVGPGFVMLAAIALALGGAATSSAKPAVAGTPDTFVTP